MIERKIIIGLITSTEYASRLKNAWNIKFIQSDMAKKLSMWTWEYFDRYGKAPGTDIEAIYYSKLKTERNLTPEVAEEIEHDILPNLSEEYEGEGINVDYLYEETLKYFNEQNLSLHLDAAQLFIKAGNLSEAENTFFNYKPLRVSMTEIDNFILTSAQIRRKQRKRPKMLMRPWLREGEIYIIYGNYGSGKSLLSTLIAYVLGLEKYDRRDSEIGPWQVKSPTGTLYIDGELGEVQMEERVRGYSWIGRQGAPHRMKILSIPEYQESTEDTFLLSERRNQLKIIRWLRDHPEYKLVVLDSISTLFGLEDENSNSEWNNKINPLLRDLRALKVACLLLHHMGKDDKRGLRGASAMGAMAQDIYKLVNHKDKDIDDGEAWFWIMKDKQRAGGNRFQSFALHFYQDDDGSTMWEVTR